MIHECGKTSVKGKDLVTKMKELNDHYKLKIKESNAKY